MASAAISPALPTMEEAFQDVPNAGLLVRLVVTITSLTVAVVAPLGGVIADRWGRRPVLLLSVILVGGAGSAGFLMDSLPAILASRALLGLGVAGSITVSTTLIADYYCGRERDRLMGYQSGLIWLGGVLFSQVGGILADRHWRYPFLLFLPALLLVPGILGGISEPTRQQADQDPQEQSTEAVSLASLAAPYGLAFLRTAIFFLIVVQLPFYLRALAGASSTQIGTALAVMNLCAGSAGMLYGSISKRHSLAAIFGGVFLVMAVGYVALGLAAGYAMVLVALVLAGLSNGLVIPGINLWLMAGSPPAARGRVIGGLTTAIHLGQFLSPLMVEPLLPRVGLGGSYVLAGGLLAAVAFVLWRARVGHGT